MRRVVLPVVLAALTVGVLAVGVFPTRTYLDKRAELRETEAQLASLRAANDADDARAAALDSDAEIERVARQEFGLAKPGEETYVVLPPPSEPVRVPEGWPFDKLDVSLDANR